MSYKVRFTITNFGLKQYGSKIGKFHLGTKSQIKLVFPFLILTTLTLSASPFLPALMKIVVMMNSRMQVKTKIMQKSIHMSRKEM